MTALKLVAPLLKCCNRCGEEKPLSDFSKNNKSKDRLQYRCRTCDNTYQAQRRAADVDGHNQYSKQYQRARRKNFEYRLQMLLNASRQRSKEKNRPHDITLQDIKDIYPVDGKCPIFGMHLEFNLAGFRDNSPSIDRIDSSKGYTRDNVQIISWKANRIKGAATLEDLELIAAYLRQGN
jgi:hypothetical protein